MADAGGGVPCVVLFVVAAESPEDSRVHIVTADVCSHDMGVWSCLCNSSLSGRRITCIDDWLESENERRCAAFLWQLISGTRGSASASRAARGCSAFYQVADDERPKEIIAIHTVYE